jgi:hypothetical protein
MRRGADHGEALGASIKGTLHNRCLRRKKAEQASVHTKRDAAGRVVKQWQQKPLAGSRVMQVWRDMVVREKLLRDEASLPFLQRTHFRQATTGFATVHTAAGQAAKEQTGSVFEAVRAKQRAESREFA